MLLERDFASDEVFAEHSGDKHSQLAAPLLTEAGQAIRMRSRLGQLGRSERRSAAKERGLCSVPFILVRRAPT
jgi:hypothetical protein